MFLAGHSEVILDDLLRSLEDFKIFPAHINEYMINTSPILPLINVKPLLPIDSSNNTAILAT